MNILTESDEKSIIIIIFLIIRIYFYSVMTACFQSIPEIGCWLFQYYGIDTSFLCNQVQIFQWCS